MAQPPLPRSSGPTLFGLAPNVAGLLAYAPCCVGFVFSLLVAALEKQNRMLRFQAFQSLLIYAVEFALCVVLWVISLVMAQLAGVLGFLTTMVMGMVALAVLAVQVLLMIKAYGNEDSELAVVGELARRWA
jgi:uncharacterized membrane protein